ncbi:hypothetical protein ACFRFH_12030 [Leifsonia sp. NPDC056824]|uniref:hypothetical protein n=1 Tax=Leifsonia sp. NPDC056824 TaxID=3345953 RepID=UPI00369DBC12
MFRFLMAFVQAASAILERGAAKWVEDAKSYPQREFYRGYEQGIRDAQNWPAYARTYVDGKESRRQQYPNE